MLKIRHFTVSWNKLSHDFDDSTSKKNNTNSMLRWELHKAGNVSGTKMLAEHIVTN